MGLFDKKECDICGGKIGMLGNKKLSDGNMCKDCAKKLSPWFTERKQSSVSDIKAQLDYREQNKNAVSAFNVTRTIGQNTKLLIDDNNRKWTVSNSSSPLSENPDILDFSQAGSVELNINESRTEQYQNIDGERRSYNPPRYEFSYDFDAVIRVMNNPYFDHIPFSISNGYVHTGDRNMGGSAGMATSGWNVNNHGSFGSDYETREYYECVNIGNELKQAIDNMRGQGGMPQGNMGGMPQGNMGGMIPGMQNNAGFMANGNNMGGMNQGMQQQGMQTPGMQQQGMQQQGMQTQGMQQPQGGGFCQFCGSPLNGGRFCSNCGAQN